MFMRPDGKGKGKKNKHDQQEGDQGEGQEARYFRHDDYGAVQRYYSGPRDLPPGLRKKYHRTGKLPPGWEKKIRHFLPNWFACSPLLL
jgi:hypothetical protein